MAGLIFLLCWRFLRPGYAVSTVAVDAVPEHHAPLAELRLAGGVVLAVFLWVASSRHTTAIWRSALNYAADTHDANVQALRSLSAVQREDARTHRIREQAQAQIGVASYRAALADARAVTRQELRIEQQQAQAPQIRAWAMGEEEEGEGGGFQWTE